MKQSKYPWFVFRWAVIGLLAGVLTACAFPKRDAKAMPDASVIKLETRDGQLVAVPPQCQDMFIEFARMSFDSRPQYPFGCATYTNLANSIARPEDLQQPRSYAGQYSDTAASAVSRYRQGEVTPLRETDTTKK